MGLSTQVPLKEEITSNFAPAALVNKNWTLKLYFLTYNL